MIRLFECSLYWLKKFRVVIIALVLLSAAGWIAITGYLLDYDTGWIEKDLNFRLSKETKVLSRFDVVEEPKRELCFKVALADRDLPIIKAALANAQVWEPLPTIQPDIFVRCQGDMQGAEIFRHKGMERRTFIAFDPEKKRLSYSSSFDDYYD
jgi:hypothetical protein